MNRNLETELHETRLKLKQSQKTESVALSRAESLNKLVKELKMDVQRLKREAQAFTDRNAVRRKPATSNSSTSMVEKLQLELAMAKERIGQLTSERRRQANAARVTKLATTKPITKPIQRAGVRDQPDVFTRLSGSSREYLRKRSTSPSRKKHSPVRSPQRRTMSRSPPPPPASPFKTHGVPRSKSSNKSSRALNNSQASWPSSSEEESDSSGGLSGRAALERFARKSTNVDLNASTGSTASDRYLRLKAHYTRKYHT